MPSSARPTRSNAPSPALDGGVIKRTGMARFDILVNNASITDLAAIGETSEELFDSHFAINVKSTHFLTKHASPPLDDGGRIVNVSSSGTHFADLRRSA